MIMEELTDKDKYTDCRHQMTYTYVTVKWSTYEKKTYETDGDEYDGDENDTYEEDNYITKWIKHDHVAHFNVNLPIIKFINKVVPYYKDKNLASVNRIYFDYYTSMELDDMFRKQIMHKYDIPDDEKFTFHIEVQKGQDWRIETLVY